jgi:hypothetical protein
LLPPHPNDVARRRPMPIIADNKNPGIFFIADFMPYNRVLMRTATYQFSGAAVKVPFLKDEA